MATFAASRLLPTPPLPPPMAMMRRAFCAAGAATESSSACPSISSGSTRAYYNTARPLLVVGQLRVPVRRVDQPEERQPLAVRDAPVRPILQALRRAERRR